MTRRPICPFHKTPLIGAMAAAWDEKDGSIQMQTRSCKTCVINYCNKVAGIKYVYMGFGIYSDEISEITDLCPTLHARELIHNVPKEESLIIHYDTLKTTIEYFKVKSKEHQQLVGSCEYDGQALNLVDIDSLLKEARHWRLLPAFG